ncbi:MAG: hypothetical protein Q8R28_24025 [Dehalococcoidia bacterium]|nr:hypothetical protein [Dehalococcoidia bacterium]
MVTKDEYIARVSRRERAFRQVAMGLGKEHELTRMMHTLAWGRHDWEWGPIVTKDNACFAAGALDGYWRALYLWAANHDRLAMQTMNDAESDVRQEVERITS